LISIPDLVINEEGNTIFYPLLDLIGVTTDYAINLYKFNIDINKSERLIWTYDGYEFPSFDKSLNFELKPIPPLRSNYKYERTIRSSFIKLPRVGIRSANKIFPEFYKIDESVDLNSEAEGFWQKFFDSNLPLIITEGQKKALSLISHGKVAIALHGAGHGFYINEMSNKKMLHLIPQLEIMALGKKRNFYISFDTDQDIELRKKVFIYAYHLANSISLYGQKVKIIKIPLGAAKGLDDYIRDNSFAEYEILIDNALDADVFSKSENLSDIYEFFKGKDLSLVWDYSLCFLECINHILDSSHIQ
jgi:hypothetical protein